MGIVTGIVAVSAVVITGRPAWPALKADWDGTV